MKFERIVGGLLSLGMAAALAVPVILAKPQDAPAAKSEAKGMGMHGDKLQAAVEGLNLTDDQKAKVKDIFADAKTQRQTVMNDSSLTDDQKKAKMKEMHAGVMAKLNGVLTPDQQAELKTKMEAAKTAKPMPQP
jgi:Spy/CpxP family protein refolding chaperone